ncbi:MAG: biotin/lipoyl-containing protein, partial [Candidatus Sulfotelmatobacter sp.]
MESVIEFKLPALGENIEQGDLVRLMIAPGATVSEGQAVMELETDKAVVEVPSSVSGKVQEILVKEGEKVKVGQVIFTVENHTGAAVAAAAPQGSSSQSSSPQGSIVASAQSPTEKHPAEPAAPVKLPPAPTLPTESQAAPPRNRSTDVPTPREFRLQELGENISEGDLVRLMIAPGAKVSEGQPVMELETDKAVVEVPSSVSGVVKDVKVKEGEKIKVGQVIFTLQGAAASQAETVRPASRPVEHVSGQHGARL